MKIAITGAHSTGKTTLARAVASAFSIPYVRGDRAAEIGEKISPNKTLGHFNEDECWNLEKLILEDLAKIMNRSGDFVTDGSSLTWIPYALVMCGDDVKNRKEYADYCQIVQEQAKIFSHIFYLPPEIGLQLDGFRPESEKTQWAIDKALLEFLKDYKYYTVRGSVAERVGQIKKILKK